MDELVNENSESVSERYVLGTVKFLIMTLPNEKRVTVNIGIVLLLTTHTRNHPVPRSIPTTSLHSLELFFPSPMVDRFYEEDEWYFRFQDFSTFQSRPSAGDYLLEEEALFSAQRCCASSTRSESCFSRDELGDLFDVDFPSFWAQIEEEDAHRKSKEGDCEKALIQSANVQTVAEIPVRRGGGSSETKKELTFEEVSRHFSVPIKQAARELNVGITVLKKQCRKLGIPRWPHRKVKSLQKLIDNVQGLGKENALENGHLTRSLVEFLQQTMKLLGERPDVMLDQRTIELSQVCFKDEENAQEDGHLTRSVVDFLQLTKKMIEERPDVILDQRTKHLRQVCFKESFKRKRLIGGHGT